MKEQILSSAIRKGIPTTVVGLSALVMYRTFKEKPPERHIKETHYNAAILFGLTVVMPIVLTRFGISYVNKILEKSNFTNSYRNGI